MILLHQTQTLKGMYASFEESIRLAIVVCSMTAFGHLLWAFGGWKDDDLLSGIMNYCMW